MGPKLKRGMCVFLHMYARVSVCLTCVCVCASVSLCACVRLCVCVQVSVLCIWVFVCVTKLLAGGFSTPDPVRPLLHECGDTGPHICEPRGVGEGGEPEGRPGGPHMEHLLPEPHYFSFGGRFYLPSREFSSGELHLGLKPESSLF